jgi:hypothetical protein
MMAPQTGLTPEVIYITEVEKRVEIVPGTEIMVDTRRAFCSRAQRSQCHRFSPTAYCQHL